MKKSLLAVAAIGAFASAAQAQSSVTVYGILDVGFIGGNTTVSTSAPTAPAQAVTKTTGNQFGQSAEQTSRLGFKGTEDLGNGTQALFTTEFTLTPQENTIGGNSNLGLQNRQTFVGLHKNNLGQAAIGTQYTGIHNAVAATDPGQANNMMGNVIYAFNSGPAVNAATTAGGNTIAYTVRMGNALTVQSDAFAGFRVNGIAVLNNKNSTEGTTGVTGGNFNTNGWGLGADYTWNKLYATAQYQAFKQNATGATTGAQIFNAVGVAPYTLTPTAAATVAGAAASTTTIATNVAQGQNVQDNQFYAAATYDFGILKAYAQYVSRKATATYDNSQYVKRSAEQIGVRSFITPTIEGWASAGLGRYTAFGANQPTANFNAWQLGSNYWLSKRTNLYAIYGATTTSNYATSAATMSNSGQNYAVGVRHTF
jgi:predicted porin